MVRWMIRKCNTVQKLDLVRDCQSLDYEPEQLQQIVLLYRLDTLIKNIFIFHKSLLNPLADLVGAAEIRPEGFILIFPVQAEPFIKIITQFVKDLSPWGLSLFMGTKNIA